LTGAATGLGEHNFLSVLPSSKSLVPFRSVISLLWFLVFVIIMIISVVRDVSYQSPRIERKMVKIVRKYVEEGRQVKKIEEHETIWIV
jgi:hypothetical protein